MVNIRPFKGLCPAPELVDKVSSPPWDILSVDDVKKLAGNNPYSLLHVTRPEVFCENPKSEKTGRQTLDRFREEKTLIQDKKPSLYVYRIIKDGHQQTGLLAAVSSQDYLDGKILLHEHTLAAKEDDRARLIAAHGACAEPVFYFCKDHAQLEELLENLTQTQATTEISDEEGVKHLLWAVTEPEILKTLVALFKEMPEIYIADGHHRSAGGARYYQKMLETQGPPTKDSPWTHILAAVFCESQVRILAYNRLVRDLGTLSEDVFKNKLSENFHIEKTEQPGPDEGKIDLYFDRTWWRLRPKKALLTSLSKLEDHLDVAIAQNYILDKILGIQDPRRDPRIDFVGGDRKPEELENICQKEGWALAICFHPVPIRKLREVAEAGKVMPPKSTWFDPKLRSGLVLLPLE
jgi:uncharacterized protein (DUF1015 family)